MDKLIKEARIARGWSVETLCHKLLCEGVDVGESTVRAWEDGRSTPNLTNALGLIEVFGFTMDDIKAAQLAKKDATA